ncbi:MAG: L-threonylcarbamoyladenylate synthase [Desulfatiglandales bacterium]
MDQKALEEFQRAVEFLKAGELVAYPTESFYALGADPFNFKAVEKIFQTKRRDRHKAILLIIPSKERVLELVDGIPPLAKAMMDRFWPGPLTLLFKAGKKIHPMLHGGTGKIGLRVSPHPVAQYLSRALGVITGTSANLSGSPPMIFPEDVKRALEGKVSLVVEWGPPGLGIPSTVVDISGEEPILIREGQISMEEIIRVKEMG